MIELILLIIAIVFPTVLYLGIKKKTYKPLQIFMLILAVMCFVMTVLSAMLGMIFIIVGPIMIISCIYYLILYFISQKVTKTGFSLGKFIMLAILIFVPILLLPVTEQLSYLFFGPFDMK